MKNLKYCCHSMEYYLKLSSMPNLDVSDSIIMYNEVFDEYGIVVHDSGNSYILLQYCPWCGQKLPDSKRDQWFDELEELGFDTPLDQEIPNKYRTSAWWGEKECN